jgi:hypothetical protein
VCPPTLTGHWVFEVEKFLSKKYLNPLQYVGTPLEREKYVFDSCIFFPYIYCVFVTKLLFFNLKG